MIFRTAEDAEQRVVIFGRNGIELVIVALGAGNREAEETAAGDVHAIVLELGAIGVKCQAGLILFGIFFRQLVAGDLGFHELIVGHVLVKRADYPVSITEGVGVGLVHGGVELVVGIARDVEPVAAPALAIMRGSQQAVDYVGEGILRFIAHE